ncbi:glycoside hydrolase family 26 protein [Gordonia sp. OPL2]|uniref:glycoside hydrolase family 26 protein n=1 Tax=Gordonia sp. OPL2 TaxID=2486274 RepID=UPI001655DCA5|nr:hypothetical protein [Gordonia sp. OPL2]ROZ98787.1 hypothetical protein EEB19_14165 [Gordonia sp. OPL2]
MKVRPAHPPRHLTRRDLLRITALGAAGLTLAACSSDATSGAVQPRTWGAYIPTVLPPEGTAASPIKQLAALADVHPRYLHRYAAIGDPAPIPEFDAIVAAGSTPLLTVEPWIADRGPNQPDYALQRIAAGDFDRELRRWGADLTAWGKPVLFRFAPKMNTAAYPWSLGVNGNTARDYRGAWSRMRTVVSTESGGNIRFVWAPTVLTAETKPFSEAYPDANEVDYVALDGYNWGDADGHRWTSAADLFGTSLAVLRELDGEHPMLITEVACATAPQLGVKANWIRDFFTLIDGEPRLEAFLWYQADTQRDWRFNSTSASIDAFRSSLMAMSSPK